MKVTLTVNNNRSSSNKLILFGSRKNYTMANWGNNVGIIITKVEFDDLYKTEVGIQSGFEEYLKGFYDYTGLLMDCIKYNLEVTSINGEEPVFKIKNADRTYRRPLNPYLEVYEMDIPSGDSVIIIGMKKLD